MSVERELKLHVLKSSRPAVETRVNTAEAEHLHLHALYFDTHDRELGIENKASRKGDRTAHEETGRSSK